MIIYVTCFIIINQLVLWDPPVNYYSISRRQGSTFNPRLSVSLHQLSGALCLHLLKVPPHSRHIWKQNCSLLHTTQSNISSAASASDLNSWHTAPPINVFDIWQVTVVCNWLTPMTAAHRRCRPKQRRGSTSHGRSPDSPILGTVCPNISCPHPLCLFVRGHLKAFLFRRSFPWLLLQLL